jgi:hypothetical protein
MRKTELMLPVLGSLNLNEAGEFSSTPENGSMYINELAPRSPEGALDKYHFNEWHQWLDAHD